MTKPDISNHDEARQARLAGYRIYSAYCAFTTDKHTREASLFDV